MFRSALHLKVLALCGLVLGLMAFTASAAQAEPGARWWIVNASGQLVELEATVQTTLENSHGSLLTKIAGVSVQFLCTAQELTGAKLQKNGSISKGSQVKYTGCVTLLKGAKSEACVPISGGVKGVIVTKKLHGLLILHKLVSGVTDHRILILPDEGEIFATIEMGEECSIGTKVNVIGTHLVLKDCLDKLLEHLVIHLLEEDKELTKLWAISKTVEHEATLDGSVFAFLIGEHLNLKWSGEF